MPATEELRVFQAWDLAISESPDASYTVGLTLGVDLGGNFYVLNIARGHWKFPTIMHKIEEESSALKPEIIGIESVGFQSVVAQGLRSKLLPIVEINQNQQKDERIRGLSANFENGRIRIDKRMEDLIMEYLRFPRGETKDILDTLEMAVRLVTERPFVYGPGQIPIVRNIPWYFDRTS